MSESFGKIDLQYTKIIVVTVYFSIWVLSCMLLYSYHKKRHATLEYNKLITKMNTKKLMDQIKVYEDKCIKYFQLAYPTEVIDSSNEIKTSGLNETKKEMYTELLKTIELYDKCNYIRIKSGETEFPYSEVMTSVLLLSIILIIILISNFQNNPFSTIEKSKQIRAIKDNISNLTLFHRNGVMKGGGEGTNDNSNFMNLLNTKSLQIKTQLGLMRGNLVMNYVIVALSILAITLYVVYHMFLSTLNYGDNLYSGILFMKSRCYKS